jgi:hypothetical protein
MLLDLMVTDEEELLGRIYSFKGKQPETQFDPKNSRRSIPGGGETGRRRRQDISSHRWARG